MTNRDLPALPEWMYSYKIPCDAFDGGDDVRLSDRMRAYGSFCYERGYATASLMMAKSAQLPKQGESVELCRAAPVGGDMPDVLHPQYRHGFEAGMKFEGEHGLMTTNKIDSAPAGSGEVTDEMVEAACDALDDACVAFHRDGHPSASVHWNGFMRSDRNAVMRAALSAALLRKLQQGADYVMVPRIPTHAMRAAGERERMSHPGNINPLTTWDAMIAASQGQETE